MRSLTPDSTSGSASLANPGSTPFTKMETPAFSAAAMTGAARGSSGAGYCSITGLEETTLMPAARKRSRSVSASKMRSSAMAVCTMQSGSQRQQRVDVARRGHAEGAGEPGQLPGIVAHLVGVRDEDPDQLELGVGVDARQGMAPDVAGAPLHDAVRHGGASLEVGERELEVGRLQAAVDLDDLAGDVGAGG